MAGDTSRLSVGQHTLLLLVVAARNGGENDVAAAVLAAVGHPKPSRKAIDALIEILDAVAFRPGEPAAEVIARVDALLAGQPPT
ncbi:hypothetical protein [Nocardia tengchongensis]|uniref:hypothetical protein n=1 Tax=Nocardia tengchongensis TaxID=2055889 RepID=UPI003610949A